MFYSGTLVCPAHLSLRAAPWPLMQNRGLAAEKWQAETCFYGEWSWGRWVDGEEAAAVQVSSDEPELSSGAWGGSKGLTR